LRLSIAIGDQKQRGGVKRGAQSLSRDRRRLAACLSPLPDGLGVLQPGEICRQPLPEVLLKVAGHVRRSDQHHRTLDLGLGRFEALG